MMEQQNDTSWSDYYMWVGKRLPRRLLLDALARWDTDVPRQTGGHAIDLGCGDGTETLALVQRGWHVLAIDREPAAIQLVQAKVAGDYAGHVETMMARFENLVLPPTDFIYAGLSLPFCAPMYFNQFWRRIVWAIGTSGRFAGHFFGERDSWVGQPDKTFHTVKQVRELLHGFKTEYFHEVDEDGTAFSGPKHWHMFEVIARKER